MHHGLAQVLHLGVLDQVLGADRGAEAAVVALGIVDHSQIPLHGDGILGADALAQAAADAAGGAATGGDHALGQGGTGDDHIPARFYRNDEPTGTGGGAGHTAGAPVFIDLGNAVYDFHGIIFAGLHAVAVAQTAKFAGLGAVAAHLGGSVAIV